ncbi:hypothetical protein PoB_000248100 [Plakobranchus ocellatus]|uniref:Uncharacterized protein n=1 Tax=Plakobranchus ocellatus TaxID=259542 RepID=A0AAV3XYR7_9GAST|nr:hypothetical protein PoB_000248100 [Plakobranchus ocellatus]
MILDRSLTLITALDLMIVQPIADIMRNTVVTVQPATRNHIRHHNYLAMLCKSGNSNLSQTRIAFKHRDTKGKEKSAKNLEQLFR